MTTEYTKKTRQPAMDYALMNYRLPYVGDVEYSEDEEQVDVFDDASGQSEKHEVKTSCPVEEYEEVMVYERVRPIWYSVRVGRLDTKAQLSRNNPTMEGFRHSQSR